MKSTPTRATLYEHVARIGKALSSPKRLELLELLTQGELTVDTLAQRSGMDIRLTSAHLRALRDARLVETQREGKYIRYRLSGRDVIELWMTLRETAEEHLIELRMALAQMMQLPDALSSENRASLLEKARSGDIVVIDVRPGDEFAAGHLPNARSIPIDELEKRLAELPVDREIVAYCRGPYCLMSDEAVRLLRANGYAATKISDGVAEWSKHGLPLEHQIEGENP